METLWRLMRRLAFLLVALVVAANTIAFVILNNNVVHDWVRDEINEGIAQDYGLNVGIGMISLNVLESTVHVENLSVHTINSPDVELARIQEMTVGFELFTSVKSLFPKPRFLRISDWQVDLALLGAIKIKKSESEGVPMEPEALLSALKEYVGPQIEIRAGRVTDTRIEALLETLNVDNVFMRIAENSDFQDVSVIAELGETVLCIRRGEACFEKSKIEDFKTNVVFKSRSNIRFEQASIAGDFGQWTASGEVQLNEKNQSGGYTFRIQGDARAAPWFSLAGLAGHGNFGANLRVVSQDLSEGNTESVLQSPLVEGRVNWRDLKLSGFDVYTGSSDVSYANRLLTYKNAKIVTPQAALIEAYGSYSFENTKKYENYAKLRDFPFMELMQGLRVPTDAIDFKMNTDNLIVRGEISPDGNKGYTLIAEGPIQTSRILSPAFETGRRRLPDCLVNLLLDTNRERMTFAGSGLSCTDALSGAIMPIELQLGRIDYLKSTTDFKFTAANAPASIVSYFVDQDLTGTLGFRARISSTPATRTNFTADIQVNNGRVFDLDYSRLSTRLYLDGSKIQCTQTEGWFNSESQTPNVVLDDFKFFFKQKKLDVVGRFDGELSDFFAAAGKSGGDIARDLSGRLNIKTIKFNGQLDDLAKAEVDLLASAKNVAHPSMNARTIDLRVFCQFGLCSESRVFAQDIGVGQARAVNPLKNNSRLSGLLSSSAIVEVESFTGKSVSMRAALVSVPFSLKSSTTERVSGSLDLNTAVQGGWSNWELFLRSRIDSFTVGKNELGAVSITGSSVDAGPLSIIVAGINDQVQGRLVFDHDLSQSTQAYLSLRSFDLFKYIQFDDSIHLNPSAVFSGDISVSGSGLRSLVGNFSKTIKNVRGTGEIYALRGQLGGDSFSLRKPSIINLASGELSYSPLLLEGNNLKVKSTGVFSFPKGEYSGRVSVAAGASLLAGLTPHISQADGELEFDAELRLREGASKVSGQGVFNSVTLAGRYLTPPITGINGRIVLQDSKIEIPTLSGTKGNGQVELVGTIELGHFGDQNALPSVAIRTNIKSAQFRIPQELFETVEATVDGQLELVGTGRPFLLNGDLRLLKGRAFRDATCQELINSAGVSSGDRAVSEPQNPALQLNLSLDADNSMTLQTTCLRGRISAGLKLTGDELAPVLAGQIRLENGQLSLLKTRFDVTRADALFDNLVRTEPRLEAQMVARIDKYSVFVGADGPLSRPRLNIWSDPSTGPDGTPLTRATLIRMISTNRGPGDTTQTAVTQAIANGVVGLFDDPLSQAVSKITRGFVDRFELQPILDAGQSTWKARVSRELGEKFNLGLDWEPNSQSLTGEIFINESVNVLGGFDRRSSQIGSYSELKGGFRFQFGGK